jgi:hypothetical protein
MPAADARALDLAYAPSPDASAPDPREDGRPPCPECGAPTAERFCGRCGEARPVPGRLRLRHLVAEFVEHLTNLDFRVARTLATLVREPGALTVAFIAGRRNRYTRPLSLYLLVSGAFFLLSPHLPGKLYDPTAVITGNSPASPIGRQFATAAARRGETRAQMAVRVRRSPLTTPRTTAALLAPVLAALATLLLARRGRLVAEHVLFAVHLQTFLLVYAAITLGSYGIARSLRPVVARVVGTLRAESALEGMLGSILIVATVLLARHVTVALQRVYGLGLVGAAWRAVALVAATPFAIVTARAALVYLVALARIG